MALTAERALVASAGGQLRHARGRATPRIEGEALVLHGFAGRPTAPPGSATRWTGPASEPAALGAAVGERMLAAGARELLDGLAMAGRV